jgi:hypothetical protein
MRRMDSRLFLCGGVVLLAACSGGGAKTSSDGGVDAGPPKDGGPSHDGADGAPKDGGMPKDTGLDAPGGCMGYSAAYCEFLNACEPGMLNANFGTLANCETSLDADCSRNLAAPGSGVTAAYVSSCTPQLTMETAACSSGPIPRPIKEMTACTVIGAGIGGTPCGLNAQCATDVCDVVGSTCGTCTTLANTAGAACGPGTGVTCGPGLECTQNETCATVVGLSDACNPSGSPPTACPDGTICVVPSMGAAGTCQASGVKSGTPCNAAGIGKPDCWQKAGFFCDHATKTCAPISYGAGGASCGEADGGTADPECAGGVCVAGACVTTVAENGTCTVGTSPPECVSGTSCVGSVCKAVDEMCASGGLPPFTFSPSNVSLATIYEQASKAKIETLTSSESPCLITTAETTGGASASCFKSPIKAVTTTQGGTAYTYDLIVVQSLTLQAGASILAGGTTPLVIVSLSDVTFMGGSYLLANSTTAGVGTVGPGGAPPGGVDFSNGVGPGGGPAAAASHSPGPGGGGFCGAGGPGGSAATGGATYGSEDNRPLLGGSAGGDNGNAGGAGGGAIQIVAAGTLSLGSGYISASGAGAGGLCGQSGGSGGAVLLEAPTVTIAAAGALTANGGAGSGYGPGCIGSQVAADGSTNTNVAASPSSAGGGYGSGGAGGAGGAIAGLGGGSSGGTSAGGGGGGVGRIRINAVTATIAGSAVISPSMAVVCATQGPLRALADGP